MAPKVRSAWAEKQKLQGNAKAKAQAKAKGKAKVKKDLVPERQPLWVLESTEPRSAHPPWAIHFTTVVEEELRNLQAMRLQAGCQTKLTLNVWSDCCGMTNEMLGARDLQKAVKEILDMDIEFKLFAACDKNKDARQFTWQNHVPSHMSDNIFDRDFDTGVFTCSLCDQKHNLPTQGVDIYVCSFSCGPWSPRGKRLGLDDAGANTVFQMVKTIRHIRPAVWLAENVITMQHKNPHSGNIEFNTVTTFMTEQLQHYNVITLNGIDPATAGYPTNKHRFAMLGTREDFATELQLRATVTKIIQNPLPPSANFREFLGMETDAFKWQRLHQLPTAEELLRIQATGCTCTLNPMEVCSVHFCQCKKCSSEDPVACKWRQLAMEFLQKNGFVDLLQPEHLAKVTYVQALELQGGFPPKSPRERNILNIVSYMPNVLDVGVFDLSQGINYLIMKMDGTP